MKILQRLVSAGADLSTKKTLKAGLRLIGVKPENIDKIYVDIKNDMNIGKFHKFRPDEKCVFIPQCLRRAKVCRAGITDDGYVCVHCGCKCDAYRIKTLCEKMGYRSFILPGGSMAVRLVKKYRPMAVMGIACLKELTAGIDGIPVPSVAVELLKDGCIDTQVDIEKVESILKGNGKNKKPPKHGHA
jgi:hypothetical protein